MRVLHVIPSIAPRYGGPSQAVLEMCAALRSEGVDVLIATTDADGDGRLPVEYGKPQVYQGIPALFFPRQWSEAFKFSYPLARWLHENISQFNAVHIHAVFSHACLAAARASRRKRVSYIVRPLGTLDPWSLQQKPFRKQIFWRLGVKRMLNEAAAIHYTTGEERRLAESTLGLENGVIIGLGVDAALLQKGLKSEVFRQRYPMLGSNPYVLVMSRIHPKKGLELLLRAFTALTQERQFREWRLVIAGEGENEYIETLKRMARKNGEGSNVLFPGWLEGSEKASALQCAELLALTSHQENFGLCLVESMACGVPVLVSNSVNLYREIELARAGWVTQLNFEDLNESLRSAMADKQERLQCGKAGKELVQLRFTWPAIARDLTSFYREIAGTTRSFGHCA